MGKRKSKGSSKKGKSKKHREENNRDQCITKRRRKFEKGSR